MKIMLTSFGITPTYKRPVLSRYIFDRMPPIDMQSIGKTFMPDYAALLLCDKIIIDKYSFDIMVNEPPPAYSEFSRAVLMLQDEGFIELADYNDILKKKKSLFDKMLEQDLHNIEQWFSPFQESIGIWQEFATNLYLEQIVDRIQDGEAFIHAGSFHTDIRAAENLSSLLHDFMPSSIHGINYQSSVPRASNTVKAKDKQKQLRKTFKDGIRSYLSFVNSNIIISNELGVGFYDWSDFVPFYKRKFLSVGEEIDLPNKVEALKRLFSVSFPEFSIEDPKVLLRILGDRRIKELRQLVDESLEGKVIFDENFAKRTLFEVIEVERKTTKYRNITSYLTMPLGLIPVVGDVVQKAAEELTGAVIGNKISQKYQWFYMLNDISRWSKVRDSS